MKIRYLHFEIPIPISHFFKLKILHQILRNEKLGKFFGKYRNSRETDSEFFKIFKQKFYQNEMFLASWL